MSNRKFCALMLVMAVILIGFLAQISEVKSLRKDTDKLSSEISDLAHQQERTWDKLDAMPTYTPPAETAPVEESIIDPDIPLADDLQEYIHHVCAEYGVDKQLVLAVMEVESDYTVDIVSPTGDYGLMQINEGNHNWLANTLGADISTAKGNIEAGVYLLSLAAQEYTDPVHILMAYNMGHSGAARALAQGITSTHYTDKVMTVLQSTAKEEG